LKKKIYRALIDLLPVKFRKYLLSIYNRVLFKRAIKEFSRLKDPTSASDSLLRRLIVGWGNQGYSSQTSYLKSCLAFVNSTRGPILECGSGLSTILISIAIKKYEREYHVLEHNDFWVGKMRDRFNELDIRNVKLHHAELVEYDSYSWYDWKNFQFPAYFSLVICDGPPAQTVGGRYGLLPEMDSRIKSGTIILLDDTVRPDEKTVIKKWENLKQLTVKFVNESDQHAIISIV